MMSPHFWKGKHVFVWLLVLAMAIGISAVKPRSIRGYRRGCEVAKGTKLCPNIILEQLKDDEGGLKGRWWLVISAARPPWSCAHHSR
jgi:hypothetical protein